MKSGKDLAQRRMDMAMEEAIRFPNFIRWLILTPSGQAAMSLSAKDRKDKYEDEFAAVLARVAEVQDEVAKT